MHPKMVRLRLWWRESLRWGIVDGVGVGRGAECWICRGVMSGDFPGCLIRRCQGVGGGSQVELEVADVS
jgi:hypothetical protein